MDEIYYADNDSNYKKRSGNESAEVMSNAAAPSATKIAEESHGQKGGEAKEKHARWGNYCTI